jgi:hypothetical protein
MDGVGDGIEEVERFVPLRFLNIGIVRSPYSLLSEPIHYSMKEGICKNL